MLRSLLRRAVGLYYFRTPDTTINFHGVTLWRCWRCRVKRVVRRKTRYAFCRVVLGRDDRDAGEKCFRSAPRIFVYTRVPGRLSILHGHSLNSSAVRVRDVCVCGPRSMEIHTQMLAHIYRRGYIGRAIQGRQVFPALRLPYSSISARAARLCVLQKTKRCLS